MLRERFIKKLLQTVFIFFILLVISTWTINDGIKNTKVSLKKDIVGIYLIDENSYLCEAMTLVYNKNSLEAVSEIIDSLKNSNHLYQGLKGLIPNNTVLNKASLKDGILYLDFNDQLFNVNANLEEKVVEALIYSLLSLNNVKGLKLSINNKELVELPKSKITIPSLLDKSFGINKEYHLNRMNDINKVVLYYYQEIDNNNYYVPVTRYLNNKDDKVKVIIDNLQNNYIYKTNLMSYVTNKIEILDYSIKEDTVSLSFDKLITLDSKEAREEVIWTMSNSIFDSLDVTKVIFSEQDNIVEIVLRN